MKKIFFVFFIISTLVSCSEDEALATSFGPLTFIDITQNSITLKWDLGLKKIKQFEVYRNSVLITTLEDIDTRRYKDINLTPNTAYNYYIKVVIDNGNFIKIEGTARTKK